MVMGPVNKGINAAQSALGLRFDISPAWKFYVEVLGIIVAEFSDCSGLGAKREIKRVREGGTNDFEWIVPGQITFDNVTLKRGVTYSQSLYRWFDTGSLDGQVFGLNTVPGGKMALKALKAKGMHLPQGTNMSIILGTVDGRKAKHWDLIGAIPVSWSGPTLNSGSAELAVESVEIAHQGLSLSMEMGTPMTGWW